jgi:hypothetical protein
MNRVIAILAIFLSAGMLYKWKDYETQIKEKARQNVTDTTSVFLDPSPETIAQRSMLEKMAMAERSKVKVMVEHDNSPLTTTYPMILDATNSFDPDIGDQIQFIWKQIAGPPVEIKPNPFAGKVSFEGEAGEYTFELTVSDDYGSEAKVTRTVVIEPEPNAPPVIDMNVRQGSELK